MARGKPKAPEGETKAGKFKRIAGGRMANALKAIGSLENTASKASYEYSDSDVEKMLSALREATDRVEKVFKGEEKADTGFTFE